MTVEILHTEKAPAAIGPYSQATVHDGKIYTSGQIPLGLDGKVVSDAIEEQAHQVLKNLSAVLEKGGSDLNSVIKTTVFLTDLGQFATVNEIYGQYFKDHHPARSTVQVAALPLGVQVEIEAVAVVKK